MKKEEIIAEIIEGILSFRIIPFFGAGMSKPAGSADWGELINQLKEELGTDESGYLEVAQLYEDRFGRDQLLTKLVQLCELKQLTTTSLRNHLRILAMNPPLIYTTNYDNALETAAALLKREYYKVVTLTDIVAMPHGSRQIVKFHGDFSTPESIVFTTKDYEKRLKIEVNPLDVLFRAHILGKSVLFLGYSFSDKNIDYFFRLHSELYGTESLNRSYIVSFKANPIREAELRAKNVITVVLESADELASLLADIGEQVYAKRVEYAFDDLSRSFTTTVFTDFEFNDLKALFDEGAMSASNLAGKLRETIEMRELPADVEPALADFVVKLITGNYDIEIKKAVALAYPNMLLKQVSALLKIAFALVQMSEFPSCRYHFNKQFDFDVLTLIEMKLGQSLNSVESRRIMASVIFAYLQDCKNDNVSLEFDHVDRLLTELRNTRYEELDLSIGDFTKERTGQILNYYFNKHGNTLKARFQMPSFSGSRTASEIRDDMLAMMPNRRQ